MALRLFWARAHKFDPAKLANDEYDPTLEKIKAVRERTPPCGEGAKAVSGERPAPVWPPLRFSLISGLNQSLKSSSASYGLSFNLEVVDANEQPVQTIAMAAAFARSAAFEGLFLLPLGEQIWLQSRRQYHAFLFLDESPALHALTFQIEPSFAMGRR